MFGTMATGEASGLPRAPGEASGLRPLAGLERVLAVVGFPVAVVATHAWALELIDSGHHVLGTQGDQLVDHWPVE